MLVSAIEPRRKGLSALFIDGEHAADVDTETLLKSGIKLGAELDDEELHELLLQSDARRASEKALYLLEYRAHSKKELEDKVARVTTREAAHAAAQRMEEIGLVDDEEYARRLAAELMGRKGFSPRRAMQELAQKGIEKEISAEIVEELAPPAQEVLQAVLRKKYPRAANGEQERRRAVAGLQRLGWGWSEIKTALGKPEELEEVE